MQFPLQHFACKCFLPCPLFLWYIIILCFRLAVYKVMLYPWTVWLSLQVDVISSLYQMTTKWRSGVVRWDRKWATQEMKLMVQLPVRRSHLREIVSLLDITMATSGCLMSTQVRVVYLCEPFIAKSGKKILIVIILRQDYFFQIFKMFLILQNPLQLSS